MGNGEQQTRKLATEMISIADQSIDSKRAQFDDVQLSPSSDTSFRVNVPCVSTSTSGLESFVALATSSSMSDAFTLRSMRLADVADSLRSAGSGPPFARNAFVNRASSLLLNAIGVSRTATRPHTRPAAAQVVPITMSTRRLAADFG